MQFELFQRPALAWKKAAGLIRRRLVRLPSGTVTKTLNGVVTFEFKPERFLDDGDFRAIVTDSYDIVLCDFLKNHLRPGDCFIDVGANVGYISAVAASFVGPTGETHCFEPLPECFARLEVFQRLNPGLSIKLNNVAVGDERGTLALSYDPNGDSRNATLVPGHDFPVAMQVPVIRLDEYLLNQVENPGRIKLIKIDVEGFEAAVLKGLQGFLEAGHRPLIVCEIKPWESAKLGQTMAQLEQYMRQFSYDVWSVLLPARRVRLGDLEDLETVLFRVGGAA